MLEVLAVVDSSCVKDSIASTNNVQRERPQEIYTVTIPGVKKDINTYRCTLAVALELDFNDLTYELNH